MRRLQRNGKELLTTFRIGVGDPHMTLDSHTLDRARADRHAMELTGGSERSRGVGFPALITLHSYSKCQVSILRGVQVQNVIEDVQIAQKQRTL
jgi:hypothetical protein